MLILHIYIQIITLVKYTIDLLVCLYVTYTFTSVFHRILDLKRGLISIWPFFYAIHFPIKGKEDNIAFSFLIVMKANNINSMEPEATEIHN